MWRDLKDWLKQGVAWWWEFNVMRPWRKLIQHKCPVCGYGGSKYFHLGARFCSRRCFLIHTGGCLVVTQETRLIYFEIVCNPTIRLKDIKERRFWIPPEGCLVIRDEELVCGEVRAEPVALEADEFKSRLLGFTVYERLPDWILNGALQVYDEEAA